ncbi:GNAT family N-acetyltransferase, partial [Salmonella enterica]|uniref:GNAT family N-acetyltransferase n=1 Tax=Salmonella enterica TaxID=28901 RepID=UPI003CE89889
MYSVPNLQKQMMEEGHVYFLTTDDESHYIGYVSIQPQGEDLFHLQKIYVLPQYQGLKAGKF